MKLTTFKTPALALRHGPVLIYDWGYTVFAGRGGYGVAFTMEVAVRNDSYDKEVGVVWRVTEDSGASGTSRQQDWHRTVLSYAGVIEGPMERWSGQAQLMGPVVKYVEFAVFASMNGIKHWDSASGSNYRFADSPRSSPGRGVTAFGSAYPLPHPESHVFEFTGKAWVWDYPGEKEVWVVFSSDGWSTKQTTLAHSVDGEWSWNAKITDPRCEHLEFAVGYRVGGVEFWDNNKGQNHKLPLSEIP